MKIIIQAYEMNLWDAVASDPVERDAFLARFPGLALDIDEYETSEEWLAAAHARWCYRPPVLGRMWTKTDNFRTGLPQILLGPGPIGKAARALVEGVTFQWAWRCPSMLRKND